MKVTKTICICNKGNIPVESNDGLYAVGEGWSSMDAQRKLRGEGKQAYPCPALLITGEDSIAEFERMKKLFGGRGVKGFLDDYTWGFVDKSPRLLDDSEKAVVNELRDYLKGVIDRHYAFDAGKDGE